MIVRGVVRAPVRGLPGFGDAPFFPGSTLALDFAAGRYKGAGGQVVTDLAALGPELVTNGDFASSLAGWTDASTAPSVMTWSGGKATASTDGTNNARLRQQITTVAGRTYQITTTTVGVASPAVGTTAGGNDLLVAGSTGTQTRYFVATGSVAWLGFASPVNGWTADDVSVREVLTGFQFTRTGAGTAEDTSGVYASFATNTPRRTNKGLLVEEARTNLTLSSLDYAGANWTKTSAAAGALVSGPDGAISATPITESGSGSIVRDTATITVVSASTYAVSKLFKRGNCDWVRLQVGDGAAFTNAHRVWINLATGVLGSNSATGTGYGYVSSSITALANGFYRVTLIVTAPTTTLTTATFSASADASTTRADVGSGAGVGATYTLHNSDVTLGAFPTSPIITTGAAATRGADTPLIMTTLPAGDFTIYVEGDLPANLADQRLYEFSAAGSANERFVVQRDASGVLGATVVVGGVATSQNFGTVSTAVRVKVAITRVAGAWSVTFNGATPKSLGSASPTGIDRVALFQGRSAFAYLNGFGRVFWIDATNGRSASQLQALTA